MTGVQTCALPIYFIYDSFCSVGAQGGAVVSFGNAKQPYAKDIDVLGEMML